MTHPGRTVTAESVEFAEARRPHAPTTLARVPGIGLLNRTFESWADRRTRFNSSAGFQEISMAV